jgi:putative oxidoreductase
MLKLIYATFPGGRAGAALLLLRSFVGVAFLFHGHGKMTDVHGFAAEFGMPLPVAAAAAYTQFIGGVLMILGAATPLAALALAATMAVATFELVGRGEPFVNPHGHSWEAAAFYLVAASAVALLGPGRFSLDALLFGRRAGPLGHVAPDAPLPPPSIQSVKVR